MRLTAQIVAAIAIACMLSACSSGVADKDIRDAYRNTPMFLNSLQAQLENLQTTYGEEPRSADQVINEMKIETRNCVDAQGAPGKICEIRTGTVCMHDACRGELQYTEWFKVRLYQEGGVWLVELHG